MKYDFLIVGAGIYGAVCARELTDRGYKCLVIDKRSHIAGNIYTSNEHGITVHEYGAHIFHTSNKVVWDYVNRFAEFNNYINSPIAKYGDEIYNLPFNMNTFSKMWGISTPDEAKRIIDSQIKDLNITEPKNLEEQALSMVGRDVYEKLVKGYTGKQWGRECKDLPSFIIKRLPLRFTYNNNYFNDRYQGIPIGGYTAMVEKMLDGIEVRLNTNWFDVKDTIGAEHIIYTGPIDEFFGYSEGYLEYRSLRFEKETLHTENYQGCAVVNYTSGDIPFTRIIEHKHFESEKNGHFEGEASEYTVITREYPAAWTYGDEPYYAINDERNSAIYGKYKALADDLKNVTFGGRLGLYRYFDMDKTVEAALTFTESIERKVIRYC